jgi:ABC-type glutathione transport system ATPase component
MSPDRLLVLGLRESRVDVVCDGGTRRLVDGVDLSVDRGSSVALLGASGAGKTVLTRLLVGLPPAGARLSGSLIWETDQGRMQVDLSGVHAGARRLSALRQTWGRSLAYLPQGGRRNLNPELTVGAHLSRAQRRAGGRARDGRRRDLLAEVGVDDPDRVVNLRPIGLSGGMARRVLLALALAGGPDLVVADEPTAGLDAEGCRKVVELLSGVRDRHGFGLLMVTHEIGDAARLCPDARVIDGGKIVDQLHFERGGLAEEPTHPAARALVESWRWLEAAADVPGGRA